MASRHRTLKQEALELHRLFNRLRLRVRGLVLVEGVSLAACALVAMFWVVLVLDYWPVRFGFNELTVSTRVIWLVMTGLMASYIVFRWVIRRIFVALHSRSLALLVERQYPEFNESLVTTVGYAESKSGKFAPQDSVDHALLNLARDQAVALAPSVDVRKIATATPAIRAISIAGLFVTSVIVLAVINFAALKTAFARLYLLDHQQWPRQNHVQLVGLQTEFQNPVAGIPEFSSKLPAAPPDGSESPKENAVAPAGSTFYVARGASLKLAVRAMVSDGKHSPSSGDERTGNSRKVLPDRCVLHYRQTNGGRGSQTLNRIGGIRNGWQQYRLQGAPLDVVLSDVEFTIVGGDSRIGPYFIKVVDEPIVTETDLDCRFPSYMVNEELGTWTDRTIRWDGKADLPIGTAITVQGQSNKPLKKVYAVDATAGLLGTADIDRSGFRFSIPQLNESSALFFYLVDTQGIISESFHSVAIGAVDDRPPEVVGDLVGIGSAITPNAVLPISGQVTDDYGVDHVWLEIETSVTDLIKQDVSVAGGGEIETNFDFRKQAQLDKSAGGFALPDSGAEVSVVLNASDRYDLADNPNTGVGDRYTLSVVSSSELLRILEQLEVGQRKRLELIVDELSDVLDYLTRAKGRPSNQSIGLEPGESLSNPDQPDRDRQNDLRKLFAQRAILQIGKSQDEISGVAESFDDIRLQLINNRVDSEDRKIRLADKIVAPLRAVPAGVLGRLREKVIELENAIDLMQDNSTDTATLEKQADQLARESIDLTHQALAQIDSVLSILVKYETQNELLDIVRRMIEEQKELLEQTKKLRQREAFDDLFN